MKQDPSAASHSSKRILEVFPKPGNPSVLLRIRKLAYVGSRRCGVLSCFLSVLCPEKRLQCSRVHAIALKASVPARNGQVKDMCPAPLNSR